MQRSGSDGHSAPCRVQVYYDPLTRRKFMSRNAYMNKVTSNKYKEAVRRSGQPAPEPIVRTVTQGPPASNTNSNTTGKQ
jgi:hypothetical protein